MTLLREFVSGLAGGGAVAAAKRQIERSCQALGWRIDERDGDRIGLHFTGDGVSPRREVNLLPVSDGRMISCYSICRATFSQQTLPDDLPAALLLRNKDTHAAWYAFVSADNEVMFVLRYALPSDAFDAERLRYVCNMLISEVAAVETLLRHKGLL